MVKRLLIFFKKKFVTKFSGPFLSTSTFSHDHVPKHIVLGNMTV
jgi:hypothetical protein